MLDPTAQAYFTMDPLDHLGDLRHRSNEIYDFVIGAWNTTRERRPLNMLARNAAACGALELAYFDSGLPDREPLTPQDQERVDPYMGIARTRITDKIVNWDRTIWSMGNEPALSSGLSLGTPPDAKLQVKHVGSQEEEVSYQGSSVTYISLVRHALLRRDEEEIGAAVRALRREAVGSRTPLKQDIATFLNESTLRTRAQLAA